MIYTHPDDVRRRRSALALTACRRWELAEAQPVNGGPSRAFLRSLKRFDPGLELYWHPRRERWILYRVRKAACPSDDYLVKELEVVGPQGEYREPGFWLIDFLRSLDKINLNSDPHQADREYQKLLAAQMQEDATKDEKFGKALGEDFSAEVMKYGYGRNSIHVNRT
jgi:hypothetical protein